MRGGCALLAARVTQEHCVVAAPSGGEAKERES